jgi:hypothetical protein
MESIPFREIAKQIGVSIYTIRRTVKRLEFSVRKEKMNKGAIVHCISVDDANKLIAFFENRDKPDANDDSSVLDRFGFFYVIQLIPEALPNRVKIGYTDNLKARLREHQTAAPTANYLGHWRCKRSWDQAAMDSITRDGCRLVMNEVYEGEVEGFISRAGEFFSIMPQNSDKPELSEHSPLKKRKKF